MTLWAWLSLIASGIVVAVHGLGIFNAAHAVMTVKSSQGAIAWGIGLVTFPWISLPLYWVLGRAKFSGYSEAFRQAYDEQREVSIEAYTELQRFVVEPPEMFLGLNRLARSLTEVAFTSDNSIELLVDGEATFGAMLDAIAQAQSYLFLQTYILHADDIGKRFQQALLERARAGVRVYLLYDAIGSGGLPRDYLKTLRDGGVNVAAFRSTQGWRARFQINFRNHRKILIADGRTGFVGGLNIGDEYLGRSDRFGPWRDTHIRLCGPAVQCLQIAFMKDWYWSQRYVPDAQWLVNPVCVEPPQGEQAVANKTVLIFAPGPVAPMNDCTYVFSDLIYKAERYLWIASPYFVPDEPTLTALKAAAFRGVDVRILLPAKSDNVLVYACSFSYYEELRAAGIQLYRYEPGFMHQKVLLMDDAIAAVGTVNLDNRSFRLNFEVMAFVTDCGFVAAVKQMLEQDLSRCREVNLRGYQQRWIGFRLAVRVTRLLAPLL